MKTQYYVAIDRKFLQDRMANHRDDYIKNYPSNMPFADEKMGQILKDFDRIYWLSEHVQTVEIVSFDFRNIFSRLKEYGIDTIIHQRTLR
jgi:hypothetical protein